MRRRAFTLMELLVAMAVFTLLGMGATAFLLMGLKAWRVAESRRDAAERAELVFRCLRADLACLFADSQSAPGRAILFSDYDKAGRQRLYFTRSLPPAGADPRMAYGGETMFVRDEIDGLRDLTFLRRGELAPPGDLLSVSYVLSGDEKLYRSIRTPVRDYGKIAAEVERKGSWVLAEGVMHIEFNFWSYRTRRWRPEKGLVGPSYFWDSTMGLGKEPATAAEAKTRFVFTGTGSVEDPRDDCFPRLVEVKLVLTLPFVHRSAALLEDISALDTDLPVEWVGNYPDGPGENFVKIDDEWISYRRINENGTGFVGVVRGRRNTKPSAHKAGALLRYGVSFRMVVRPATGREPWRRLSGEVVE